MAEIPDFLPPIVDLQGTWEETLERLYTVFCRDFKKGAVYHRGTRILYDNRILSDGCNKEEGFWHVVSREDRDSGERLFIIAGPSGYLGRDRRWKALNELR